MENPTEDFNETTWASLKKDLKTKVGESAYNNWLKHLNYVTIENEELALVVSVSAGSIVESRLKKYSVENVDGSLGFRVFGWLID